MYKNDICYSLLKGVEYDLIIRFVMIFFVFFLLSGCG